MITREDIIEYAMKNGRKAAASLLLLNGPDAYYGSDYDKLLATMNSPREFEKLKASEFDVAVYRALSELMIKNQIVSKEEVEDAFARAISMFYADDEFDDEPEYLTDEPGFSRDYSPSAPWNAPGMKVSDFI